MSEIDSGFEPFFVVFFIILALVIGFFLFLVVGSIRQYSFNNKHKLTYKQYQNRHVF